MTPRCRAGRQCGLDLAIIRSQASAIYPLKRQPSHSLLLAAVAHLPALAARSPATRVAGTREAAAGTARAMRACGTVMREATLVIIVSCCVLIPGLQAGW